jgi:hypothetical protein
MESPVTFLRSCSRRKQESKQVVGKIPTESGFGFASLSDLPLKRQRRTSIIKRLAARKPSLISSFTQCSANSPVKPPYEERMYLTAVRTENQCAKSYLDSGRAVQKHLSTQVTEADEPVGLIVAYICSRRGSPSSYECP